MIPASTNQQTETLFQIIISEIFPTSFNGWQKCDQSRNVVLIFLFKNKNYQNQNENDM
jgi:hypothetical protein